MVFYFGWQQLKNKFDYTFNKYVCMYIRRCLWGIFSIPEKKRHQSNMKWHTSKITFILVLFYASRALSRYQFLSAITKWRLQLDAIFLLFQLLIDHSYLLLFKYLSIMAALRKIINCRAVFLIVSFQCKYLALLLTNKLNSQQR